MRPEFIPVGQIVNAHGIRGEVKLNPAGFDPAFLAAFDTLYIGGKPFDSDFSCVIESAYFSSRAVLYR